MHAEGDVDPSDSIITAALQLVADERLAQSSPMATAALIRDNALGHVIALATLAMHEGRAGAGATLMPDGRVVFVIEVRPKR